MSTSVRLLPLVLVALTACPAPDPDDTSDAGDQEIADLCNTPEEALSSPECQLTPGQPLERYISFGGDTDWYSVQMPSTVGPRSLVRVTAVYATQITAVNLFVSLLREDGTTGLVPRRVDEHGQGQPKPIEILVPFTEPGAKLLLHLGDVPSNPSRPGFDVRSPYSLTVEVLENPDANEPNDTAGSATPVALTNQGGILVGSGSGYLATAGDVDRFSFDVPAGKIAYVRLTAPSLSPQPAPAYILSYKLLRPDGNAEAEGRVRTNVVAADLATARRVKAAGKWQVLVQAWKRDSSDEEAPPGDTRLKYTLDVKVLDEGDPNEDPSDNDELGRARVSTFSEGPSSPKAKTSFTGRLGSVPDLDWYGVDVPADTTHTLLHYRLIPLSTGGRFPALPELPARQVRVLAEVPGFSAADCTGKVDVCPKGSGYGSDVAVTSLVSFWCNNKGKPLCLHSSRDESEYLSNLRNFEGSLPVPPHGTPVRYYFLVQDEGTSWADDKDYHLEVEWVSDPDETNRKKGGTTESPSPKSLARDDAAAFFPAPPTGADYEVHGSISHGMGRLVSHDLTKGQGLRGPVDYDAVTTDVDTFLFQLPSGLSEPIDRTWELQWEVANLPDGGTPYGLSLDLTFCDGTQTTDGGSCKPVSTGSAGAPLTLAYRGDLLRAWHSPSGSLSNLQPLYSLERGATSTKVTVQPYACSCLEPRFIRGGTLTVAVGGVDRTDYGQADYTLRTAHTQYPKTYSRLDGGTASCPAPDAGVAADGGTTYTPGCYFTRQP